MGEEENGKDLGTLIRDLIRSEGRSLLENTVGKDSYEVVEQMVKDEVAMSNLAKELVPYVLEEIKGEFSEELRKSVYETIKNDLYSEVSKQVNSVLYTALNPKK